MEPQDYSAFADLLSKFHTASEPIQALMIVAVATVAITSVWCLTAPLRLWLSMLRERGEARGQLVYALYRDPQGRWLVYADGDVRAVDAGSMARWVGAEFGQRELTLQPSCPALGRASTSSLRAGVGSVDGRRAAAITVERGG